MTDETYDPFKTDTGLPDDFDGAIVSAEFKYHDTFTEHGTSDPQVGMAAKIATDDADIGEVDAWFKVGKGWEPADNGARLERNDGKKPHFHANSHMGLMVDALKEIDAPFQEHYSETGMGPMDAGFWEGFNGHWERKTFKGGGEVADYQKLLPNKFFDWVAGSESNGAPVQLQPQAAVATPAATPTPAAAPASKATKKSSPASKSAPAGDLVKGVEKAIWDQLFVLAYNADDVDSFRTMASAALPDTPENQAVIMDESTDSVWELAVAKWKEDNGG